MLLGRAPVLAAAVEGANNAGDNERLDPARLWDGDRQLVFAYQKGPEMGDACRLLDGDRRLLPVKLIWRLPPDWVQEFPTIHFEVSSRRWKSYTGWQGPQQFIDFYNQFNPPPRRRGQLSPFKPFVDRYETAKWSWPGRITDHLLDPNGPHAFSEYELRGLSVRQKKMLHSADHLGLVKSGRRPPALPLQ